MKTLNQILSSHKEAVYDLNQSFDCQAEGYRILDGRNLYWLFGRNRLVWSKQPIKSNTVPRHPGVHEDRLLASFDHKSENYAAAFTDDWGDGSYTLMILDQAKQITDQSVVETY